MKTKGRILIKSVFVLAIFFCALRAVAIWTAPLPGQEPPTGGGYSPLNIGEDPQGKGGSLAVVGFVNFARTIFRDDLVIIDGGDVGIGTETPTAKLDVIGAIKITDGTQNTGKFLTSDANGLASWVNLPTAEDNQTPWATNINANGYTLYGNSLASGNLRMDSTSDATKGFILLNPTGGNVGIGKLNPSEKLDINGNLKISGSFIVGGSDGTPDQYLQSNGVGNPPTWTTIPNYSAQIQQLQTAVADLTARVNALETAQQGP